MKLFRLFFLLAAFTGLSAARAQLTVANPGFELPVLAAGNFTSTLNAWTNLAGAGSSTSFIEYITGFNSGGNQHLGLELNAGVYQQLGVTYAANTVYRLRVAVGNRSGQTLTGNLSAYALTEPTRVNGVSRRFDASTLAPDTFAEAPALLVDTAVTPALVGKTIRIGLNAVGTGRSHFDNVRLDTPFVVTTTTDAGSGSLRQALADAALIPGAHTLSFAAALNGQTLTLASAITIAAANVTVDASSLTNGLTVSGNHAHRIFYVNSGANATLRGLTLTNGNVGTGLTATGGAIYNGGTLNLTRCTLAGNSASFGGAIYNEGPLVLAQCTLSGNSVSGGGYGGAIYNRFPLTLTQCTLNNNSADVSGGAIYNPINAPLNLTNCTLTGNSADTGGAIESHNAAVKLAYSIVAGNTAATGADIYNFADVSLTATVTRVGSNLVQSLVNSGTGATDSGPAAINAAPLLAPLAANGGPTKTMALLVGSPARDAAAGSPVTSDQRGFPIIGPSDIGAFEAQLGVITNVTTFVDSPTAPVNFVAGTVDPLTATSSVPALVMGFSFGGSGTNRTVTITPAPGQTGSATITVIAGLSGETRSFTLTVVPFAPRVVTSTNDSGPGSLRQALADAAAHAGADTITFTNGFTGPIFLTSGEIVITDTNVTIDASSLPGGLTISGGNASRIFTVSSGAKLTLTGLTLTGGIVYGGNGGGAILNSGTLALTRCTLSGNATVNTSGAAISNLGTLTLTQCTLSDNSTDVNYGGGAIYNGGTLTLTQCTLSGNSARAGGAIGNFGGTLTLTNSIVAGNTATSDGADIYNDGLVGSATVTRVGANLVQSLFNDNGGTDSGTAAITNAPRLAPLADNGGPTKTMALLPGSPALDAATVIPGLATDQRGFPRNRDGNGDNVSAPDIGAYEAQAAPFALGFNFNGVSPRNLLATDIAGAPGFAQPNWNNLSAASATANRLRTNASGGTVTVRTWHGSPNVYQFGTPTTPDQKLMSGYLDSSGTTNSGTNLNSIQNEPYFALADLPAAATLGGYKVVVYADTDAADGRTGEYWLTTHSGDPANITGTTDLSPHLFLADTANFTGTYTRVPASSTSRAGAAAGNYFVLENQTQPAFILRTEDAPSPRAGLNAVQIVRNEILVVTTVLDENDPNGTPGNGLSLREALRDAPDGAGIVFDSTLSGATLMLTNALGEMVLGKNVTIDASSLPGGLTISGNNASRIFTVSSGKTVALLGLTLTGGNGVGASLTGGGGAIENIGTLTLTHCTLSGNSATGGGGAILNYQGTLMLARCTLSGNTANVGGAIWNDGTLTLTQCTLSDNSTRGGGGAIFNNGTLTLTQCTLSGNSSGGGGGAISTYGPLTLTHCTLSGNSAGFGGAIYTVGGTLTLNYTIAAGNTPDNIYGSFTGANNLTSGNPLLAPLGNYGGPIMTMALLPGSPARNAATNSTITSDQRGFPIVGVPDLGAYEAGTLSNFNAWIWELLPATATGVQHATDYDYDNDGVSNGAEFTAGTNPLVADNPNAPLSITVVRNPSGSLTLSFPTITGRTYTLLQANTPAAVFVSAGVATVAGNGATRSFTVTPPANLAARFYRVSVSP